MAKVHLFTNLDEAQSYLVDLNKLWGNSVPSVGHDVEVPFDSSDLKRKRCFRLRVVSVTWRNFGAEAWVELHSNMPGMSIRDWTEWFKRMERNADD
jgi:hypothetical protein